MTVSDLIELLEGENPEAVVVANVVTGFSYDVYGGIPQRGDRPVTGVMRPMLTPSQISTPPPADPPGVSERYDMRVRAARGPERVTLWVEDA